MSAEQLTSRLMEGVTNRMLDGMFPSNNNNQQVPATPAAAPMQPAMQPPMVPQMAYAPGGPPPMPPSVYGHPQMYNTMQMPNQGAMQQMPQAPFGYGQQQQQMQMQQGWGNAPNLNNQFGPNRRAISAGLCLKTGKNPKDCDCNGEWCLSRRNGTSMRDEMAQLRAELNATKAANANALALATQPPRTPSMVPPPPPPPPTHLVPDGNGNLVNAESLANMQSTPPWAKALVSKFTSLDEDAKVVKQLVATAGEDATKALETADAAHTIAQSVLDSASVACDKATNALDQVRAVSDQNQSLRGRVEAAMNSTLKSAADIGSHEETLAFMRQELDQLKAKIPRIDTAAKAAAHSANVTSAQVAGIASNVSQLQHQQQRRNSAPPVWQPSAAAPQAGSGPAAPAAERAPRRPIQIIADVEEAAEPEQPAADGDADEDRPISEVLAEEQLAFANGAGAAPPVERVGAAAERTATPVTGGRPAMEPLPKRASGKKRAAPDSAPPAAEGKRTRGAGIASGGAGPSSARGARG